MPLPQTAYNLETKRLGLLHDDDKSARYLREKDMSERQRNAIISDNFPIPSPEVAQYVFTSPTNRVKEFKHTWMDMVKGRIPINLYQLQLLVQDVEKEMHFRQP